MKATKARPVLGVGDGQPADRRQEEEVVSQDAAAARRVASRSPHSAGHQEDPANGS
jgi:hypothetical protein